MQARIAGMLAAATATTLALAAPAQAQGKDPPGVNPAHYQCYRVTEVEPLKLPAVKLADQFGTTAPKLLKPIILCTPVAKNGAPVKDKTTHLVCYEEEGAKVVEKKVVVTNQFGKETLTVGIANSLCVPSLKTVLKQ